MSHFSVMVTGDNLEEQLAPFHEFECTGVIDQYVVDVDITKEVRAQIEVDGFDGGLDCYGLGKSVVNDLSEVDRFGDHKWGFAVVQDGELVQAVNRTNPNKKWDWWVIGGRWAGFYLLTPEASSTSGIEHASQTLKRDIDIEGMRSVAAKRAEDEWKEAHAILDAASAPHTWSTWKEMLEASPDVDTARMNYHAQPSVEALRKYWSVDQYIAPLEDFVRKARNRAISPFAVLHNGEWQSRGDMGWFGCVSNEDDEWDQKFSEFFDSLPDDTLITIVDCHI